MILPVRNIGVSLSLALLASCGSESPSALPPGPTFAYVLDRRLPKYNYVLSAYKVDGSTGAWTRVGSVADVVYVSLDPKGRFLIAEPDGQHDFNCDYCSGTGTLVTYGIDSSSGALSMTSKGALFMGGGFESVAVNPSGRFLQLRTDRPCNIEAAQINSITGAIIGTFSDVACGSFDELVLGDNWVALEPMGRLIYYGRCYDFPAAQRVEPSIFGYRLDIETGNLGYIGQWGAGACFAIDPSGHHLYSSMPVTGQLGQFAIDDTTGELTPTGGTPSPGTPGPLVVHPSGRLLYLASGSDIVAYRLDSAGVPSLIRVVASGVTDVHPGSAFPRCSLALDSAGRYLYILRSTDVLGYSVNAMTGDLQPIPQAEGGGPGTVAAWVGTWGLWIGLVTPAH